MLETDKSGKLFIKLHTNITCFKGDEKRSKAKMYFYKMLKFRNEHYFSFKLFMFYNNSHFL